jgi:hypothetical protein
MHPVDIGLPRNNLKRKTFRLFQVDDALASQSGNLTKEKLTIAVEQAFSLWSAVARLNFVHDPNGTGAPDVPITFRRFGESDAQLGNGLVDINIDQDFFVDPFTEPDPHPTRNGPFDLVRALAHEIGHKLGLDHPPAGSTEPALMSGSQGPGAVLREIFPFDIAGIQGLFGAIQLSGEVAAPLAGAILVDAAAGVTFNAADGAVVVGGPHNGHCIVDCFVDARGRLVNSVNVKFNLVSRNVMVNTMELWDGLVRLQTYSLASRASGGGLAGRTFNHHVGLLARRTIQNHLRVRFDLTFKEIDAGVNGVAILQSVAAATMVPEPILQA